MKRTIQQTIIVTLLVLSIMFGIFVLGQATSDGSPVLAVGNPTAQSGNTVDVTIELRNNPGLTNLILFAAYDADVFTLTNISDGGILGQSVHTPNWRQNPYQMTWENDTARTNFTADGTLVTLTFAIAENAQAGEYAIHISCRDGDAYNFDLEDVFFAVTGGTITVTGNNAPGNLNTDGVIDDGDIVVLRQHLLNIHELTDDMRAVADVNGDGVVDIKDLVRLKKLAVA